MSSQRSSTDARIGADLPDGAALVEPTIRELVVMRNGRRQSQPTRGRGHEPINKSEKSLERVRAAVPLVPSRGWNPCQSATEKGQRGRGTEEYIRERGGRREPSDETRAGRIGSDGSHPLRTDVVRVIPTT